MDGEVFLVWIAMPLVAWLVARLIWRRSGKVLNRAIALVAGFAVLSLPWLVTGGIKAYYDRQVREMCAKDGGVEIYETVVLPAEKFDRLKRRNFALFREELAEPGDEYYIVNDDRYYKEGFINFVRMESRIVRRSDGKVIGKSITYLRTAGDPPGPWHNSSFMCPDPLSPSSNFETVIFQRGDEQ